MPVWFLAASALLAVACSNGEGTGDGGVNNRDGSGGSLDGSNTSGDGWTPSGDGGPVQTSDAGVVIQPRDGGAAWTCYPTTCAGHSLECGDCVDNDGDGRVDWQDQECQGPCDNSEGPILLTGVGGEGGNSCNRDCYFDFGNGSGNDTCRWDTLCDRLSPDPHVCPYEASEVGGMRCPSTQTPFCKTFCEPLTPNGCDCFGCCTFPELAGRGPNGGPGYVFLGSMNAAGQGTCTFDKINDPNSCHACIPVESCNNGCGPCEVCIGRPMPPAECFMTPADAGTPVPDASQPDSGPPATQCPGTAQPCGLPGQSPCAANYYCITGCCVEAPG